MNILEKNNQKHHSEKIRTAGRAGKFSLRCGVDALLIPLEETRTVTVLVLVKAGSEYEIKEQSGISHFLEHMCFKGTTKRPSSKEISVLLDQLGANSNAFTSQEHTGYYIKTDYRHWETAIDLISDIYLNSIFKESDIEKERGVIIEEMNMYEDMPTSVIYDYFLKLLYGDQPAGWKIIGEKDTIKKIKQPDFLEYLKKNYTANKTLVVVSGKFNRAKTLNFLEKAFGGINRHPGTVKLKTREAQKEPKVAVKSKKSDQAHLILGARAFSKFDDRRYALQVLSVLLGRGMSSRLFQKIREEMGIAYYVHSSADLDTDHGFFGISAGVALNRVRPAVSAIMEEFKRISSEPLRESELKKAKDYIKGTLALDLESSDEYAFFYGFQQLYYGRTFSLDEIFKKIDSVNARMISELAKDLFQPKNLNLALLGPFNKKKEEAALKKIISN